MKRALPIFALLALAGLAMGAARPASDLAFRLIQNGEPVYVGVLTSTGASVTNATTAVPFTLNGGEDLKFICDAEGWIAPGGTASLTFSSASLGQPSAPKATYNMLLRSTTVTVSMISTTGTANCAVWKMQ